jgi:alpha-N-acetylgalactosaminidase
MSFTIVDLLFLALATTIVVGLDNGLARTPPMGWLSWERFRCNVDCSNDPDNCIGEKLFKDMADVMERDGFLRAGYEYVIIDDCWLAKSRDSSGRLQPDPTRFPNGIRALADYIHAKGLKFGIYGDFGTHTCAGYPGNEYYLQYDAQTYANWTVDYFKMDGCYSDIKQYDDAYPAMGMWLNKTGRPILYSCSWPAYQEGTMTPDYVKIAKYCNIWRNFNDIDDSWNSVKEIIKFYGDDHSHFVEVAGPGHFNDPDMLIIGNYGLSWEQQRTQMALWSIMASPLIMSVDLRIINKRSRTLLLNRGAISINQDALGIQGKRIKQVGNIQVWTRPVLPSGSWAFVLFNAGDSVPSSISIQLSDLGMVDPAGYNVTEVFDGKFLGIGRPNTELKLSVNPNGVFFGKGVLLG